MKIKNLKSKIKNRTSGFTLLELLVAIAILMIIVMMMSGIFYQSRIAWGSGLTRSTILLKGRAALDLMATDLSQAVASERLPFGVSGSHVDFFMFYGGDETNRAVKRVHYNYAGTEVTRQEWQVRPSLSQPYPWADEDSLQSGALIRDLSDFSFSAPSHSATGLPAYVDIEFAIEDAADVSFVNVGSGGRRGWSNEDDNIWSSDLDD